MGRRRRSREYALQMLFEVDLAGAEAEEIFERFWQERNADDEVRRFAETLVRGVLADRAAIDERIREVAERWRLERMPVVDRNVLRMAIHEMDRGESPAAVIIDEAIEIARRFGGESSGKFTNGILDQIRRRIGSETAKPDNG